MKEYVQNIICYCLSLCLALCVSSAVASTEQVHSRTDDCPMSFKYLAYEYNNATFCVEVDVCDSNQLKDLSEKLQQDIDSIINFVGKSNCTHINVYIIDDSKADVSFNGDGAVYIPLHELRETDYRVALCKAILQTCEPGIANGIVELIFNGNVNEEEIKGYLSSCEDLSILGLFGAYFSSAWSSDEEISIAKKLAAGFCSYMIQENDLNYLLRETTSGDKIRWLNYLGVQRNYDSEVEILQKQWKFHYEKGYASMIETPTMTFYLNPKSNGTFNTANDVQVFMLRATSWQKDIISYLNAIDTYAANPPTNDADHLFIRMDETAHGGHKVVLGREMTINVISDLEHLFVHSYADSITESSLWQAEGFAEYVVYVAVPNEYKKENIFPQLVTDKPYNEYYRLLQELYTSSADLGANASSVDLRLYMDCASYLALSYPNLSEYEYTQWPTVKLSDVNRNYTKLPEGGELSYAQAGSYVAWLVDNYGIEKVVRFVLQGGGTEIFSRPYAFLKQQWMDSLDYKFEKK